MDESLPPLHLPWPILPPPLESQNSEHFSAADPPYSTTIRDEYAGADYLPMASQSDRSSTCQSG